MSDTSDRPIIIKRPKIVVGGGHHGGAWKVAYADFVTAMMAFFLLMWLLGATSENQRKGIADYFNPTITVNKTSGGGSDIFGGDSVFTDDHFAASGTGPSSEAAIEEDGSGDASGKNGIGTSDNSEDLPFGSNKLPALAAEIEEAIELSDFADSLKARVAVRRQVETRSRRMT